MSDDPTSSSPKKNDLTRLIFPREWTAEEIAAAICEAGTKAKLNTTPDTRPAVAHEAEDASGPK